MTSVNLLRSHCRSEWFGGGGSAAAAAAILRRAPGLSNGRSLCPVEYPTIPLDPFLSKGLPPRSGSFPIPVAKQLSVYVGNIQLLGVYVHCSTTVMS